MVTSANLRSLNDDELLTRTREVARREQELTLEVVAHLEEVARRRLFAARGYPSLFEYAVKALGYSEPAASQRVAAMRLVRAVPEARERMKRGVESKRELVAAVSGQSARATERLLVARASSPAVALALSHERARPLTPEHTELKLVATRELMRRIERARELKGAHLGLGEIFAQALDAYLDREDPLRRETLRRQASEKRSPVAVPAMRVPTSEVRRDNSANAAPETRPSRYISVEVRREVARRSNGCCEFIDSKTGRRCESRTQLQWDHILPFAKGGPASIANIRQVCLAHQQWAAIQSFGPALMERYLTHPTGQ